MDDMLESMIEELYKIKKKKMELDKKEKEIKAQVEKYLKDNEMDKYSGMFGTVYIATRKSVSVNKKKLAEEYPEIFEKVKVERVSSYLAYTVPKKKKKKG